MATKKWSSFSYSVFLVLLLQLVAHSAIVSAEDGLISNGDFEVIPANNDETAGSASIPDWKTNGTVEFIESGQKQGGMILIVPQGLHAVRLGNDAEINQELKLEKGSLYSITFSAARTCAQLESLNISVPPASQTIDLQTLYSVQGWDTYAWAFEAQSDNGLVVFRNPGMEEDPTCGPIIDDIAIKKLFTPEKDKKNMVINGDFEEGPWMFRNTSLGVLLPTNLDEDTSSLPGWNVESNRAVRYIDSDHFSVPGGKRAVELVSGKEGIISQMVETKPQKQYSLIFSLGHAGGLYQYGFPLLANCVEIGLPELILIIIISQYLPRLLSSKRSIFDRFAVLFSVGFVWLFAFILTIAGAYNNRSTATQFSCRTDRTGLLRAAPWIRVPYPFQWGSPTFRAGEVFAMMVASFVALIESTGTFIAVSRFGGATPIPSSVLSRGIGWQGIGLLLNGLFGTVTGCSASVENAGLLGMTRVGSRRVIQISAGFMIFFSVLGKFGALFATIPLTIFAAMWCIFFAYVGSAGIGLLQFCNLNSFRTKFILGISLFLGLSIPHYFHEYFLLNGYYPIHTGSTAFNDMVNVIFLSNATVAVFVALFLDSTLDYHDSTVWKESGVHWWEKFRYYKTDLRSEEFYSLPYSLNKYFPSV